jgi:glyoxylase-like metal-dependent hydrolase (beta-lactamase superfamily II)
MTQQIRLDPKNEADIAPPDDNLHVIAEDLAYLRTAIVNVIFFGLPHSPDRGWVLVDAGVVGTAGAIREAAEKRFGRDSRPSQIILTHAHFDHVGSLEKLSEFWDVPIYAHLQEFPFLTGQKCYPPANPRAGGGLMALLSPLYPRYPIDVSERLLQLPPDTSVPGMPGWLWIHTPGHSPGHVSLWREADRTLIAGDAFITTAQESAYAVLTQRPEMHGPPKYFTSDWPSAADSVRRLAMLDPDLVITGHGPAMRGAEMREALHHLSNDFRDIAIPRKR